MKKLSIIIVTYENGETLRKCLDSIYEFNDLGNDLQVIVIDNSPEDKKNRHYVSEAKQNCLYLENNNRGFGAGNNYGESFAEGEILGFLNPDVFLIEPIFIKIYQRFINNEKIATLGCKLFYADMKPSRSFTYEYEDSLLKKLKNRRRNKRDDFHEKDMFTSGCNLFIRKDLFEKAGKFDENYFMYYEEADLKNRIRNYDPNLNFVYCNDLKLIHLGGSESFSDFRFQKLNDSAIYYGKKWNLDYKKKIKYEYDSHKLKKVFYRFVNREKYDDVSEVLKAYEKYYSELIR